MRVRELASRSGAAGVTPRPCPTPKRPSSYPHPTEGAGGVPVSGEAQGLAGGRAGACIRGNSALGSLTPAPLFRPGLPSRPPGAPSRPSSVPRLLFNPGQTLQWLQQRYQNTPQTRALPLRNRLRPRQEHDRPGEWGVRRASDHPVGVASWPRGKSHTLRTNCHQDKQPRHAHGV